MENLTCLILVDRKLQARGDEVRRVKFKNVNPLKVGNLSYIIKLLRDLGELDTIIFEDCVLNKENITTVGNFIRWKQSALKKLEFINCGIRAVDIEKLLLTPANLNTPEEKWEFFKNKYGNLECINLSHNSSL